MWEMLKVSEWILIWLYICTPFHIVILVSTHCYIQTASWSRLVHDGWRLWWVPQPLDIQFRGIYEEEGADPTEADPETHLSAETANQWGTDAHPHPSAH